MKFSIARKIMCLVHGNVLSAKHKTQKQRKQQKLHTADMYGNKKSPLKCGSRIRCDENRIMTFQTLCVCVYVTTGPLRAILNTI